MLRDVSERILDGAYVPDPLCAVKIPKASGGFRTLRVATVRDRVVARAVLCAIESILDPRFLDNNHGFRPHRSPWTLLSGLEQMMIAHNQPILVNADIRGAFDHVQISAVMEPMSRVIDNPDLLDLTETILRGHSREEVGTAQGNPLSPIALNVLLHDAHDLRIGDHTPSWWRYADNLGAACHDVSDGHQHHTCIQTTLDRVGMTLKGNADEDTIDLREGQTSLLGYVLSIRHGRMRYETGPDAWRRLEDGLILAHHDIDPPMAAQAVVRGWIEWCGPTFANKRAALPDRVHSIARRLGFREIDPPERLGEIWEDSWMRWEEIRTSAIHAHDDER